MKSNEVQAYFCKAIGKSISPKKRKTPRQKRKEIAEGKIEVLERVAANIRKKARENPSWDKAYFSAITTIEFEIQEIKNGI